MTRRLMVVDEAARYEATQTAVSVLQLLYEAEHAIDDRRVEQARENVREARRDLETLLGEGEAHE